MSEILATLLGISTIAGGLVIVGVPAYHIGKYMEDDAPWLLQVVIGLLSMVVIVAALMLIIMAGHSLGGDIMRSI